MVVKPAPVTFRSSCSKLLFIQTSTTVSAFSCNKHTTHWMASKTYLVKKGLLVVQAQMQIIACQASDRRVSYAAGKLTIKVSHYFLKIKFLNVKLVKIVRNLCKNFGQSIYLFIFNHQTRVGSWLVNCEKWCQLCIWALVRQNTRPRTMWLPVHYICSLHRLELYRTVPIWFAQSN